MLCNHPGNCLLGETSVTMVHLISHCYRTSYLEQLSSLEQRETIYHYFSFKVIKTLDFMLGNKATAHGFSWVHHWIPSWVA